MPEKVLQDPPAHEQSQSRAVGFGREERLKQPAAVGDRDSSAVVNDRKDEPTVECVGVHVDLPLVVGRVDRVQARG